MILGIYGTGGSGREVYDIFDLYEGMKDNWEKVVFIDDTKPSGELFNCEMMPFDELKTRFTCDEIEIIIAVGEPSARKMLYSRVKSAGYRLATIVHPRAQVSKSAVIKEGVLLQEGVLVSSNAVIEENVYVNAKSIIGHDTHIGAHCQISSFSIVAGFTTVGEGTFIGLSSQIRDHISVGDNVIVSMGASVMKSVNSNRIVMGNPAREIAENTGKVFK